MFREGGYNSAGQRIVPARGFREGLTDQCARAREGGAAPLWLCASKRARENARVAVDPIHGWKVSRSRDPPYPEVYRSRHSMPSSRSRPPTSCKTCLAASRLLVAADSDLSRGAAGSSGLAISLKQVQPTASITL